ncbi:MAG: flagellar basal body-associated FliL family protein [Beijerinckiaceae bacterium]|nr:flagellar basal body-associated FliL family protein [Beijerinckiaceae bacterium]
MINADGPPTSIQTAAQGPSLLMWLCVMAVLTICAVAAGAGLGLAFGRTVPKESPPAAMPPSDAGGMKYGGETAVQEVPPVITNLAGQDTTWVRVQTSIVFDRKALQKPETVAAEIGDDILAFMRTLSLAQISGASGLQHLREDLNERAAIRSGGLVRELILQSVVVQ